MSPFAAILFVIGGAIFCYGVGQIRQAIRNLRPPTRPPIRPQPSRSWAATQHHADRNKASYGLN